MANTIIGRVMTVGQTVNVSKKENPFYKRELVLNASRYDPYTGEERRNVVTLTFTQKNCDKLDAFRVGDIVNVDFFLQGREYTKDGVTKYITDVVAYNINAHQQQGQQQVPQPVAPQPTVAPAPQPVPQPAPQPSLAPQQSSELPF